MWEKHLRKKVRKRPASFRSSRQRCSVKKGVLRNFEKFTGKHLCQRLFLMKLQALCLRPATLLKNRPWHWCFPVNFTKFLRTLFYIEHLCWLLLHILCLHFLRINHNYFFQRVFESVREQFLSGNISGLLVIYLFNEMTLKLYFMKCLERKISLCILPLRTSFLQSTYWRLLL